MLSRQAVLTKLQHARAVLGESERQGESGRTTLEWQKGYVKALEEVLDLEGVSLRRHSRHPVSIPAEVVRVHPVTGAREPGAEGTILDLSVGGCGLVTATHLAVGDRIELTFRLPGQTTIHNVAGVLRRAERLAEHVRAGVEF